LIHFPENGSALSAAGRNRAKRLVPPRHRAAFVLVAFMVTTPRLTWSAIRLSLISIFLQEVFSDYLSTNNKNPTLALAEPKSIPKRIDVSSLIPNSLVTIGHNAAVIKISTAILSAAIAIDFI
jgi:hypothetical protein